LGRLLKDADVFFSNRRPGYLERYGLTAEELCEKKPVFHAPAHKFGFPLGELRYLLRSQSVRHNVAHPWGNFCSTIAQPFTPTLETSPSWRLCRRAGFRRLPYSESPFHSLFVISKY
jgi:CoA-transferase family III